jgi:hypothetical protein
MAIYHDRQFHLEYKSASRRLLAAGLLCSLWCASSFANASKATVVYPTGVFPTDGINVQAAADKGGTVLLKATNRQGKPTAFNFGTPDPNHGGTSCSVAGVTVSLNIDVAILGEQVGQKMTTINGGCTPILGLVPVRSKIEGIDFEAPVAGAIVLTASTGTEIVGNHINGVLGALVEVESGFEFTDGDGIDLFGDGAPQNSVSGHAIIANNVIENLGAEFANGVQLDEVAAEVDISGNTIRFAESNGDVQVTGITAFRSHNRVSIVGNEISMGAGSPNAFPVPILVGGHSDARYIVAFNNVVDNHPNGDGIAVTGGDFSEPTQNAQILANRVTLNSLNGGQEGDIFVGASGVDVYGAVNNSLIAANVIRGTSAFGLNVDEGFLPTSTSDSDQLLINDISGHTSFIADVYFGTNTSNLQFTGKCKSDIDLGVDNKIDCNLPAKHGLAAEENAVTNLHPGAGPRRGAQRGMTEVVRNAIRNHLEK